MGNRKVVSRTSMEFTNSTQSPQWDASNTNKTIKMDMLHLKNKP